MTKQKPKLESIEDEDEIKESNYNRISKRIKRFI